MADTSQDKKDGSWAGAPPPARSSQRPSRAGKGLAVALLAVVAGYLGWRYLGREAPLPPPAAAAGAPAAPAVTGPTGPAPATAPSELSLRERVLLDAVSDNPAFRQWLDAGDPLNRWALVVANLAEGVVPRKALAFLAPAKPFEATERGGLLQPSEASYRRYDLVGDVVASVELEALGTAYRTFHTPLEAAYRALGDPQGSLDVATAKVLDRLAKAPVLSQAPALEPAGGAGAMLYVFKDPKLEALGAVEKQLLRLGPRNGGIIRNKAAALRSTLGLPR